MSNNYIQTLTVDGTTYDLKDNISGYATLASPEFTGTPTAPTASVGDSSTQIATTAFVQNAMSGAGAGTVTSITAGSGLQVGSSGTGTSITSSGTINHLNSVTAQTTQALYPIKIDAQGHISAYGSAISVPTSASSATTGITVDSHSTTTIYGVQSTTTTASKASGGNGTAPTLGNPIEIPNLTVTGTANYQGVSATDITVPKKNSSATSIPNVTAVGSGSFTQGTFTGGSLLMSMDTTDTKKLNITFAPATHGADSHTHVAPTLGTAISIIGVQSSTTTASKVILEPVPSTVLIGTVDTSSPIEIPNVTSVGSASTWSFSDVTVPIKNSSNTTVVTSGSHNVNDSGHTHTLS